MLQKISFLIILMSCASLMGEEFPKKTHSIFAEFSNNSTFWESNYMRSDLGLGENHDNLKFESFVFGATSKLNQFFKIESEDLYFQFALRLEQYTFKSGTTKYNIKKSFAPKYPIPVALEGGVRYQYNNYVSTGLLFYIYGAEVTGLPPGSKYDISSNMEYVFPVTLHIPLNEKLSFTAAYRLSTDFSIDPKKIFDQQNTFHFGFEYKP